MRPSQVRHNGQLRWPTPENVRSRHSPVTSRSQAPVLYSGSGGRGSPWGRLAIPDRWRVRGHIFRRSLQSRHRQRNNLPGRVACKQRFSDIRQSDYVLPLRPARVPWGPLAYRIVPGVQFCENTQQRGWLGSLADEEELSRLHLPNTPLPSS
jgi:hypothetical protein